MSWIGRSLGLGLCEDTGATSSPRFGGELPLSTPDTSLSFEEQLAAMLQTTTSLPPFKANNALLEPWNLQTAFLPAAERLHQFTGLNNAHPLSQAEAGASRSLPSSCVSSSMRQPAFLFSSVPSSQQPVSPTPDTVAELQARLKHVQREADILKAEQAVLRAENEALAADKAVVQSENGMLRDRMRIMEATPFVPFFEPVIREAPDSDPIHVMAARGHCDENCTRPCCQFPISPDGTLNGAAQLHLTVHKGSVLTLTAGECARMPQSALASLWKEYVNACAACLPDIENNAEARARMHRLVIEVGLLMGCKAFAQPKGLRTFHATKMEDGPFAPASPSAAMSAAFVHSLNLSQGQLEKLVDIQAIWHQELSRLRTERNTICLSIRDIPSGAAGSGAQAGAYLRLQDGICALKENLRKDHVLHIRLFHLTWKSCFTAEQCAKIVVQSYPWCPDAAAICNEVAARYQHPIQELPTDM
ncbi:hypothetical protein WJX74_002998 [Apatococcus lobatus]|uniref:Uncharacterized protein n=2 Tax=Apatococcus TaxID=904362 RepID=A0AAW1THP1_9CHLO